MNKPKIYFPNLNGLRCIAAFLVIIHHIEQFKLLLHLKHYWDLPFVGIIGKLGVVLFFVLSGFLITYLLLEEDAQTKTIAIKDFYIRRILRIWPLYYLIVILSFFVFPYIEFLDIGERSALLFEDYHIKLILFILFIPNLAQVIFKSIPFAWQSWSVGVEEQFYLLWPLLMKKFKNTKRLLLSVILVYIILKIGFYIIVNYISNQLLFKHIYDFINTFSIDCMAIGGLFAYFLFSKQTSILNLLFSKGMQTFVYLSLILGIGFGLKIPFFHYEVYGTLFGIVILNLAANKNSILSLENYTFNYLGKISYGLYMFHPIAIVISLKLLVLYNITSIFGQYLLSISLTIIFAGLSYRFYESYFIKKKKRFSKILSGENAINS